MIAAKMNTLSMRSSKSAFVGTAPSVSRTYAQPVAVRRGAVTTQAIFGFKTKVKADPYICRVCGYVVQEAEYNAEGFKCPECGFPKFGFKKDDSASKAAAKAAKGKKAAPEEPKKKFGLF
uniref:Rubredoxin-like domain-containing protein n=1 Tax=Pyramimonas obovata TaxID=1411642 RepID=A0A7S0R2Z1_9CHLO|mmetsp:Transcript_2451/g.5043  ORF Transcript_2451/g.5043 Transcript_2451/m.5043 type:complete len:120 (+) Transcript_2451:126-485(+)|eukprot:CAMPEP_0118934084 /NCGR_PEP_ID=MMETSP1169-20130426/13587_1 /TAXON_ID=36882 /ORGANISM="Pyramimonas obovata, Strain CCMP722" /LENGTH=119 /DNA_ID=CAMNT_0006876949 /DNA_START=126 /DNA_END=485 /DNA_ORIENTATION=+